MRQSFRFFLSAAVMVLGVSFVSRASVPTKYESEYLEAVVLYGRNDFAGALKILSHLRQESPRTPEFLELAALSYTGQNDDAKAASLYDRLLELGPTTGMSTKDLASFSFQLGLIRYRQKRYGDARLRFSRSIAADLNVGASHFYQGLCYFDDKKFSDARNELRKVLSSDATSLKPSAQIYLARAEGELGETDASFRDYIGARNLANQVVADEGSSAQMKALAAQVAATADKELRALDKSELILGVGLVTGYDSNVLSIPNGSVSGAGGASPASFVETLLFAVSYATSPIKTYQLVPSYRGSINYNFNHDTDSGEFFSNDVTVFITRDALAPTNYGLKLEGTGTLQYQTAVGNFDGYLLGGSFGPFLKYAISPGWALGADVFFQPQKYYLDPTFSPTLRQSGWDQLLRAYFASTGHNQFWNPGVSVTADYNSTAGEEYRGTRLVLQIADTLYLSSKTIAAASLSIGAATYPVRLAGARNDQNLALTLTGGHRLTHALSLIATVQFLDNFSSVATYRYTRLMASIGANYAF